MHQFALFVTTTSVSTPPPLVLRIFLDFRTFFSPSGPSFGQYDSPINLAESGSPTEGTGTPYQRLHGKLQQSCPNVPQVDRSKYDRKDILWAFVFGSKTGHIWARSQLSVCSHTPTVHSTSLSFFIFNNYFSISVHFFPRLALHFLGQHNLPSNIVKSQYPSPTLLENAPRSRRRLHLLLLLSLYEFNSTPAPRMYLDHEGNRKYDISPSWGQPNTRVHTTLSRRRARQGPGEGDSTNAAFMPPRTMKILGEGRPRGPRRRRGNQSNATRLLT